MPLYEYRCERCEKVFEVLVRRPEDADVRCSGCGGPVERILSTFAVSGGGEAETCPAAPPGGCGTGGL
jgi:putative FmdB family regulatory protein